MNNQSISERIAKVWIGHAHIDDLIAIGREVDAMSTRLAELESRQVDQKPVMHVNPNVIGKDGQCQWPTAITFSNRGPCGGWTFPLFAASPLAPRVPEELCEDEGCPQHGIPHVCVTTAPAAPADTLTARLEAELTRLASALADDEVPNRRLGNAYDLQSSLRRTLALLKDFSTSRPLRDTPPEE